MTARHGDVAEGPGWQLFCGDYRDVLADVEPDAVITDPPYSERTERGVRSGSTMKDQRNQIGMGYRPINEGWARALVARWDSATDGWLVIYGDHITNRWYESAMQECRYAFPPLPLVKVGAAPRMCADGPASQSEWIATGRPRSAAFVGAWPGLVGWYRMQTVRHGHGHQGVRGGKSADHMRAIVRDYSRPGDLVCDPCAGGGTTLLAAVLEGRRAIGAELDPVTFTKAVKRLRSHAITPPLFHDTPRRMTQVGLDPEGDE